MASYAAFLRGINVGGHHKVPMVQLKMAVESLGTSNVKTLLNSGNVTFDSDFSDVAELERLLEVKFATVFGFNIPTMVVTKQDLDSWISDDPFGQIEINPDIRLYISIVRPGTDSLIQFPIAYDEGAFQIVSRKGRAVASVLDLSITKTVKGMEALEKLYGKDITTRNWNTIIKVSKLF
jgi:uncharacterized protein (DUF1697 family)